MFGYEPDELSNCLIIDLIVPDALLESARELKRQLMDGCRVEVETVRRRKDGSYVHVSLLAVPVTKASGEHALNYAIYRDITERKRAEERLRESEARFQTMADTAPVLIWMTGTDGLCNYFNKPWLEFTGRTMEQEVGLGWTEGVHPNDVQGCFDCFLPAFHARKPFRMEYRLKRADGEYRWVIESGIPRYTGGGEFAGYIGSNIDITDRKRAESLLAGEKLVLEMLAKGDSLAEILHSLCRLVEEQANGVLASILLLDGDRLRHGGAPSLPKAYADAIDGIVIGPSAGSCGTAAYRGEPVIVADIATDPLWATYRDLALPHSLRACWSTPVFSSQGKVIATFAMYHREPRRPTRHDQEIIDQITLLAGVAIQQKAAQEKLQRSEAYLAEAQKLTHTGGWVWDARSQKVLYCSEEMFRIYGLDPSESSLTRENFRQRIHPEDRDWVEKRFEKVLREKKDGFAEYRVRLTEGKVRYINASGHPVIDEDGELIEFVGTAVDVTERKRTELERRRLASLVEQAADLMAIADLGGGTPIYLNKAGLKMVGFDSWEEARTRRGIHYMFPEDRQFVNEVLWPTVLEKGCWSGEMRFRHFKTGEPIPILYSAFRIDDPETGQPVNIGNVCRDITERKRAEAEARENNQRYHEMQMELAHANRVAAVGQLTASIAHEVNQPLTAVATNAEAALRWLRAGSSHLDEVRQALTSIIKDGNRAAEVINRIRALIKKAPPREDRLEVNGVILEIIE